MTSIHRLLLFLALFFTAVKAQDNEELIDLADEEPAYAVLYPSLIVTFGLFSYYLISRYLQFLPYTGVIFVLGACIGAGVAARDSADNHIHETVVRWQSINSEVILLTFLPGLCFSDSIHTDPHLFRVGVVQIFNFAFPLVLGGAVLTALVAYYIFPYGWSFYLSMTFGSILAATDPAAVAALLDELGAPPRLSTHIGGESLMNDGSAIVFFSIFSSMFFSELGIEGFGERFTWGSGIALFCRKALGSIAVGIFFGLGMIAILCVLNKRLSSEENTWQVAVIFAMAYLNFYVADFVWETSGVMATLSAGLLLHFLGRGWLNDPKLFNDFFEIVETFLNTILFSLGGLVWGGIIVENYRNGVWTASDWGYLFVAYVFLNLIRAFLFLSIYPVTKRIGLKSNIKETIFQIWGGLRGAVAIALAISLNSEVIGVTTTDEDGGQSVFQVQTAQLYQMVGGISFLTLIINGITAGPLLKKLGLVDEPETRKKIIAAYKYNYKVHTIDQFVHLLTYDTFQFVDFSVVRFHIPYMADLTRERLANSIRKMKQSTPPSNYKPPHLKRILPYLPAEDDTLDDSVKEANRKLFAEEPSTYNAKEESVVYKPPKLKPESEPTAQELRLVFLSLLRAKYSEQMDSGELESDHPVTLALQFSLTCAETECKDGKPINDFFYLQSFENSWMRGALWLQKRTRLLFAMAKVLGHRSNYPLKEMGTSVFVAQMVSFIGAHKSAEQIFQDKFGALHDDLSEDGKTVIAESEKQVAQAIASLKSKMDPATVRLSASHKICKILLNKASNYVEDLNKNDMLKNAEAQELLDEIQDLAFGVVYCTLKKHDGEMKFEDDVDVDQIEKENKSIEESAIAADEASV